MIATSYYFGQPREPIIMTNKELPGLPSLSVALLNIINSCHGSGNPIKESGLIAGCTYMLGATGAIKLVEVMKEAGLIKVLSGYVILTDKGNTFRLTPDILDRLKEGE